MASRSIDVEKVTKKCIKPVLTGHGSDAESLVQAIVETYEEIRKELEEQGYVVAPFMSSTSRKRKDKEGR